MVRSLPRIALAALSLAALAPARSAAQCAAFAEAIGTPYDFRFDTNGDGVFDDGMRIRSFNCLNNSLAEFTATYGDVPVQGHFEVEHFPNEPLAFRVEFLLRRPPPTPQSLVPLLRYKGSGTLRDDGTAPLEGTIATVFLGRVSSRRFVAAGWKPVR